MGRGEGKGEGKGGETTRTSYGQRMKESMQLMCIGLVLIPVSLALCAWNEANLVCTGKAFDDVLSDLTDVSCAYDAANNAKSVHIDCAVKTCAEIDMGGVKTSDSFLMEAKSEVYQWVEDSTSKTEETSSGSSTTTKCYCWKKEWSSTARTYSRSHASCSAYSDMSCPAGYGATKPVSNGLNTAAWPGSGTSPFAKIGTIKTGSTLALAATTSDTTQFTISPTDALTIDGDYTAGTITSSGSGTTSNFAQQGTDNIWYLKKTGTTHTYASPGVGDMRVTFTAKKATKISGLGEQSALSPAGKISPIPQAGGSTFPPCDTREVFELHTGSHTGAQLIKIMKSELKSQTVMLRILTYILCVCAVSFVFAPLSTAPHVIPCCGELVAGLMDCMICVFSCTMGTSCWMFVFALTWVFYRPMIGGPLLFFSVIMPAALRAYRGGKKVSPSDGGSSDVEAPKMKSAFELADKDGDGTISKEEFEAAQR